MFKIFAIFGMCVAFTAAIPVSSTSVQLANKSSKSILGVVSPTTRCGGVGTPIELRISECEGICYFQPGHLYNAEMDFFPSSASPSLSLRVAICPMPGFCTDIINAIIPNSSVQPGYIYTTKYNIVPNDLLSKKAVEFQAYLSHTDTEVVEICVSAEVVIL